MQEQGESSRPSSSERSSSSGGHHMEPKEGMESDDEIGMVPELGLEPGGPSTSGRAGGPERAGQSSTAQGSARRRGRTPADKEHKRLKRYNLYLPYKIQV